MHFLGTRFFLEVENRRNKNAMYHEYHVFLFMAVNYTY